MVDSIKMKQQRKKKKTRKPTKMIWAWAWTLLVWVIDQGHMSHPGLPKLSKHATLIGEQRPQEMERWPGWWMGPQGWGRTYTTIKHLSLQAHDIHTNNPHSPPRRQEGSSPSSAWGQWSLKGRMTFLSHAPHRVKPIGAQNKALALHLHSPLTLAASLSLALVFRLFEKNLPRQLRNGTSDARLYWEEPKTCKLEVPIWLIGLDIKIKYPPPFPLETLKTADSLAVSLTG